MEAGLTSRLIDSKGSQRNSDGKLITFELARRLICTSGLDRGAGEVTAGNGGLKNGAFTGLKRLVTSIIVANA